jgi:hypothetical protein
MPSPGVCLASTVNGRPAVMATLDPDDGSVAPHEELVLTVEALRTGG